MPTSSEFLDSGRFPAQKMPVTSSSFSQTCSLLSQYLKQKGTFGDLSLGMSTMNLFPVAEKPGPTRPTSFPLQAAASPVPDQELPKKQPESAQMTIFYAGQVIAFNDFPADKAKEIMMFAGKETSPKPHTFQSASSSTPKPAKPSVVVAKTPNKVSNFDNHVRQDHVQPIVSDLPIARKASLTRFLEKRKDRITARTPYQGGNHGSSEVPSGKDESKAWLVLAAQSPVQFQSQS